MHSIRNYIRNLLVWTDPVYMQVYGWREMYEDHQSLTGDINVVS